MKTVIGLMIVVLIIVIAITVTRDNPGKWSDIFGKITPTPTLSPTPTGGTPAEGFDTTSELTKCTTSMMSVSCSISGQPVCGYEGVTKSDGTKETVTRDYLSSCHYCSFFGTSGSVVIEGATVTSLGFTNGLCK